MLYVSLFLALPLLLLAWWAARPDPLPVRWGGFLGGGGALAVMPACALWYSPANVGLFLLLALALASWPFVRRRVRSFVPLAAVAFLAAYGVVGQWALKEQAAADRLRAQYPVESMGDRVPEPPAYVALQPAAEEQLGVLQRDLDGTRASRSMREYHLRRLHEDTVGAFVNSPGFGVARLIPSPTEESLRDRSGRGEAPAQPGLSSAWPPGATYQVVTDLDRAAHRRMHANGVLDFVNPDGWGYVTGGRRGAGFLRHAFSRVPEPAPEWRLEAVELIGLLRHPEPVVYRSDRLPAMADLRDAPTRPLDPFEVTALTAVRRGEDGFAARWNEELRFVGGIRSANQCVPCHGGARGDLLGAFSYLLRATSR